MTTISNWQLVSSIYLPLTSTYYQDKFQSLIAKANPCFPKVFNLMEMTVFDEVETGAGSLYFYPPGHQYIRINYTHDSCHSLAVTF